MLIRDSIEIGWLTLFLMFFMIFVLGGCESAAPSKQTSKTDQTNSDTDTASAISDDGSMVGSDSMDPSSTESDNPCLAPNPPAELCMMIPSGPACGDGEINQENEICDDGNTQPGDGCTGVCKVEPNWACNVEGEPCELLIICGNGRIEPGEVCDDGNDDDDDGCNSTCEFQSPNYICPKAGEPCVRVVFCGDQRINGDENCEDGNTESGDGCDQDCHREEGWSCPTPNEPCLPPPYCGDAELDLVAGEACDDGNSEGGDGCSADCTEIESGYICPSPGEPCQDTTQCGDGRVTGEETCDDVNDDPDDGCHDCVIQKGYTCPYPAAKCVPKCGDGLIILNEECDDGNTEDGDGCTSICEWEDGFVCSGEPPDYNCRATICGDGIIEGTEGCDDSNGNMGDGCTPLCDLEPDCSKGACTSICGDGLLLTSMGEECDDGNINDEDGCSSDCKVETTLGFECKQPSLDKSMTVPVVYRDFNKSHVDFEPNAVGLNDAVTGLVASTLDAEGKPTFAGKAGGAGLIDSAASFAEWYRDVPGKNATIPATLTLYNNGNGGYVNRWGENGGQYQSTEEVWCGDAGDMCEFEWGNTPCDDQPDDMIDCVEHDGTSWGVFLAEVYDGNPVFFPIDNHPDALTPTSQYYNGAKIPPAYDVSESWPSDEASHNFHFTSEVRYWFQFNADETYVLDFMGDDDVWVFVNDHLAVDLGGIHTPVNGVLKLSTANAADYGMVDGEVYEIVVFQAERQTESSTYKLTLSGFNTGKSDCGPICGDGEISPGEQCDDGEENVGGYNKCESNCTRGPYCGDGNKDPEEECDDGVNVSAYGTIDSGCAPGCVMPPHCGDGIVQGGVFGETCDDGVNDNSYGGCSSDCQMGPWCGDGIVQEKYEECDDALNDGSYGNCNADCTLGPRCGDGILQEDWNEICDDGNNEGGDECSPNCQEDAICGDAFVDPATEDCDDGLNDGGYGECAPGCKLGPHCGDGAVETGIDPDTGNPYEQCDDSINDGGYGECSPGCVLGPHCGDGVVQPAYEECDDANDNDKNDGCTSACKKIVVVPV